MVIKYSDGYYLEGQDYWRLAGIFDDILVYATPTTRLFDWYVQTVFDADYKDAELKVDVNVKSYKEEYPQTVTIKGELCETNGRSINALPEKQLTMNRKDEQIITLTTSVNHPRKWTAETPNLYLLKLYLYGQDGNLIDHGETRIGFKQTKIIDSVFYLNGVPLKVNAQN